MLYRFIIDYFGTCLESNKGGCEHYCLNVTSGKGFSCACYAGYKIGEDSKKCEGKLNYVYKILY
jgi:hypothetical protein